MEASAGIALEAAPSLDDGAPERLRKTLAMATAIWGNERLARRWLTQSHPLLQGASPMSLLETEPGTRQVEILLSALDNGFPV